MNLGGGRNMVSYCQVEGINTFFVVEVSAAAINSYETDMLYNNFVEGIIQPEFRPSTEICSYTAK